MIDIFPFCRYVDSFTDTVKGSDKNVFAVFTFYSENGVAIVVIFIDNFFNITFFYHNKSPALLCLTVE